MIRLKRTGRKNDPSFRVVVTEKSRGPKSNNYVEKIGFYNPKEGVRQIDADRASYWISKGAQPSGTVHNMLVDAGVLKTGKINVLPQKSPVVTEKPEEAQEGVSTEASVTESEPDTEEASADETQEEVVEAPAEVAEDVKEEAPAPEETKEEVTEETPEVVEEKNKEE